MNPRIWSRQQTTIFEFFINGRGHLVVRARAGTGKTTTIVEAVKRYLAAHPGRKVVVCAFNTRIKDELITRFMGCEGVEVKTLHAMGYSIVRRFWSGVAVERKEDAGLRAKSLTDAACGHTVPDKLKKIITKLHTLGREILPHARTGADLLALAQKFECEPGDEWLEEGWTTEQLCDYAARAMAWGADHKPARGIDFADMVFLPCRHGWMRKWADDVIVDEAQDMNAAQLEIAEGICKGRLMLVGDDCQAIYDFRGADSGSLDRLKTKLGATELPLTTTYRCGKAIVAYAQALVPDFEAGPNNPEGEILGLHPNTLADEVALGDFVLSRLNAPLVGTAMALLRKGIRAQVAGKNIGKELTDLVWILSKTARSIPEFLARLEGWTERSIKRAKHGMSEEATERAIDKILDTGEMLRSLSETADSVKHVTERIEALFTDDGLGQAGLVTCSSVHKAKGLEADRVFILADTLKETNQEEKNIKYVAITRAKTTLVMVSEAYGSQMKDLAA